MNSLSLPPSARDTRAAEPCALRAATTLVPRLQAAGASALPQVWRAAEWNQPGNQPGTATDCLPTGFSALDHELPGQGWPRGQLVELLVESPGLGELGLLLPALAGAARTGRSCVWVLPCTSGAADTRSASTANTAAQAAAEAAQTLPYAPALVEAGLDLTQHIFVRPLTARESCWALEQSLRTAHLGALIGWLPDSSTTDADFRGLRRLHLLAQRHRALVFVLRPARHAQAPSPAALRLHVRHDASHLQVQILKRRGRPLLEPVALQVHPARWNRTAAAQGVAAAKEHVPADAQALEPAKASPSTTSSAASSGATAAASSAATSTATSVVPNLLHMVQALTSQSGWSMPEALQPGALAPLSSG